MEPSYMGTFTGARRYVLHTFANTQSALMRKRVSRFMEGKPCPTCHGKRLKPEALSVTFAGVDIGAFMQMPLDQLAALLRSEEHTSELQSLMRISYAVFCLKKTRLHN